LKHWSGASRHRAMGSGGAGGGFEREMTSQLFYFFKYFHINWDQVAFILTFINMVASAKPSYPDRWVRDVKNCVNWFSYGPLLELQKNHS
jgi:hypothetical protein